MQSDGYSARMVGKHLRGNEDQKHLMADALAFVLAGFQANVRLEDTLFGKFFGIFQRGYADETDSIETEVICSDNSATLNQQQWDDFETLSILESASDLIRISQMNASNKGLRSPALDECVRILKSEKSATLGRLNGAGMVYQQRDGHIRKRLFRINTDD